jgi:hypothetical protein
MSSAKSVYIDLSKTQFSMTPDGQYCYTIDATTVNNKPVQGHECWKISSNTFSDRVNCMCDAINNAFYGYKQSVGATDISVSEQQLIYNDIVRQFLPFINQWQLCDGVQFMTTRDNYLNSQGYKDKAVFDLMALQSTLISNALIENQCAGSVSVSGGMSSTAKLALIILAIVVAIAAIWFLWRRYGPNASSSSSSSSSSPSASRKSTRRAISSRRP